MEVLIYNCRNSILFIFISYFLFVHGSSSLKRYFLNKTEVWDLNGRLLKATISENNHLVNRTDIRDLSADVLNATTFIKNYFGNTTEVRDPNGRVLNATTSVNDDRLNRTEVRGYNDRVLNHTISVKSYLVNKTEVKDDLRDMITERYGDGSNPMTPTESSREPMTETEVPSPTPPISVSTGSDGDTTEDTTNCGLPTKHNEYPWIVAIYNSSEDLTCAGAIISPFHVITTVQCFEKTFEEEGEYKVEHPENYLIITGKHHSNIHKKVGSHQKRKIKNYAVYRPENPSRGGNLTLLEVDQEFSENDEIRPICMDWEAFFEERDFKDGKEAYSVGWEYENGQLLPCNLRNQANVQYMERETCLKNLEMGSNYADDSMLSCAKHIDANERNCGTDTGSSLFFKSNGERYYLRGILEKQNWISDYQLYIRIPSYYNWLKAEMGKNHRISFKTPGKSTNDEAGCNLPKHIKYGKFTLTSGVSYGEGEWVRSDTTIQLHCDESTKKSLFLCNETMWVPSIHTAMCRQPGTCPSIVKKISVDVKCEHDGDTINCTNPPINATAKTTCSNYYTHSGPLPISRCVNEEWNPPLPSCTLECGRKRVNAKMLSVGSKDAKPHEYPWLVGVYNSTNGEHICGGTIITRKHVLSAAHCFSNGTSMTDESGFTIIGGKYYRDINVKEEFSEQKRKIKELHIHDDYKGITLQYRYDIAVIEVDQDFEPSEQVGPACVDWDSKYENTDFKNNNLAVVPGWGFTAEGGNPSYELKKLEVPYKDTDECKNNLPRDFSERYYFSDKICAGYKNKGKGVCHGDSGGGLYFNSEGEKRYIRGIVSITVTSNVGCNSNYYALYTKVSMYLDWIGKITQKII